MSEHNPTRGAKQWRINGAGWERAPLALALAEGGGGGWGEWLLEFGSSQRLSLPDLCRTSSQPRLLGLHVGLCHCVVFKDFAAGGVLGRLQNKGEQAGRLGAGLELEALGAGWLSVG